MLTYALHNTLEGFSRIPVVRRQLDRVFEESVKRFLGSFGGSDEERAAASKAAEGFGDKLSRKSRPFMYSDLPEWVRREANDTLLGPDGAAVDLVCELRRCFDLPSESGLVRAREGIDRAKVSLSVGEEAARTCGGSTPRSRTPALRLRGEIGDMVLVPGAVDRDSELGSRLEQIGALARRRPTP